MEEEEEEEEVVVVNNLCGTGNIYATSKFC